MSFTNSLVNTIMGNSTTAQPIVPGTAATVLHYTDRSAATIHYVDGNPVHTVWLTEDDAKRVDKNGAFTEAQEYEYTPRPVSRRCDAVCYTLRKNGKWVRKGESMKSGQRISIGFKQSYHDYSF